MRNAELTPDPFVARSSCRPKLAASCPKVHETISCRPAAARRRSCRYQLRGEPRTAMRITVEWLMVTLVLLAFSFYFAKIFETTDNTDNPARHSRNQSRIYCRRRRESRRRQLR